MTNYQYSATLAFDGAFDYAPISGRALQRISFAGTEGAGNLLAKARRAFADGDVEHAQRFVDRAARLPFDDHEQAWPGALAVHMDLFDAITDAVERAPEDDSRWLDAALRVLPTADAHGACDLRDVLVCIDQDYAISGAEHRRIIEAVTSVPDRAELRDLELTPTALCEHITSVLAVQRAYEQALAQLSG